MYATIVVIGCSPRSFMLAIQTHPCAFGHGRQPAPSSHRGARNGQAGEGGVIGGARCAQHHPGAQALLFRGMESEVRAW